MENKIGFRLERRAFIKQVGAIGVGLMTPGWIAEAEGAKRPAAPPLASALPKGKADVTLRLGPVLVELDKGHTISTLGYNGQVPAPVLRLQEGKTITVDLFNDTDTTEFVHWHGQIIPAVINVNN